MFRGGYKEQSVGSDLSFTLFKRKMRNVQRMLIRRGRVQGPSVFGVNCEETTVYTAKPKARGSRDECLQMFTPDGESVLNTKTDSSCGRESAEVPEKEPACDCGALSPTPCKYSSRMQSRS